MKKITILLAFLMITTIGFSQSFKGYFRPIDDNIFVAKTGQKAITSVWLFRPVVEVTALQFTLTNPVEVSSLSSLGTGLSYQHFIDNEGVPYNNFGVNGLILFNQDPLGVQPAKLSFAVTVNALQYVNIGAGYSLAVKKFFLLTGITYNFN